MKSSQPVIFLQHLWRHSSVSADVNVHVGGCTRVSWGAALGGGMYKAKLNLTTSCCPVHPTAGPALLQPVLTCSSQLPDSPEMRAGQILGCQSLLLPVLALQAFLWP